MHDNEGMIRGWAKHLTPPVAGWERTSPLDRGLVGEWRFNSNTGLMLPDYSGYRNDGTIVGAEWASCQYGRALDLERGDAADHVNLGASTLFDFAIPFTLEYHIYFESFNDYECIYERGAGGGTGIEIYIDAARGIRVWDGAGVWLYTMPAGVLYHHGVLVVRTAAAVDYYAEGELVNLGAAWTYAQAGAATAYLGAIGGADEWFDGKYLLFRMYDRELSAQEIRQRYQICVKRPQPMTHVWTMPQGLRTITTIIPVPPTPPVPPVPPVIIPTTPTLHQMTGLSLSVFKPTIIYADPITYIPNGAWIEELRDQINGWNHASLAVGGYDKAGFTINDRQDRVERWFEEGLGNHIECYNHAQDLIWEGFVNKVSINLGPLSAVRGPLLNAANHVAVRYSELDTQTNPPVRGEETKTAYAADLYAQSLYGYIGGIVSGGTATTVDAEQIRDTFLAENSLPQTTQSVGGAGGPGVTIECLGYYHWFKTYVYNQITNTGTENLSTKLTAVINAEWNTIINGNMDIVANTLAVDRYENKDKTAWALIKALVALGDANSARYLFGVWAGRRAIYEAAPTTEIAYQQHLQDPARRVKTLNESIVMPWDVLPGKWIFFPDFLVGRTQDRQRRRDPRYMFIESVSFNVPWDLKTTGGKTDLTPQLMARLGLAGTGG